VLWPLGSEAGSEELPVVFLEVQMRAEQWRVVVITPHRRLNLGPITPLRGFLDIVQWVRSCSPCRCSHRSSWANAAAASWPAGGIWRRGFSLCF
jgi:hypothetical protein